MDILLRSSDADAVSAALTTAFNGVKTDYTSMLGAVLPAALGVMAVGLVTFLVVKLFKKIAK